ncbi:MAG: hypothetical protein PVF58_14075 [Candidatus Methanofastidiosia archaeon]|jgi:hypothetical protein
MNIKTAVENQIKAEDSDSCSVCIGRYHKGEVSEEDMCDTCPYLYG